MTPLPEPDHFISCDNGRIKVNVYFKDTLERYGAAEYKRGITEAMACYSPDDLAADWMDKIRKLGEKA